MKPTNDLRRSSNGLGTFGRTSTGRFGDTSVMRKSYNGKIQPPNLRTASRSSRLSYASGMLISEASSNGQIVSARTENIFKNTIDYAA